MLVQIRNIMNVKFLVKPGNNGPLGHLVEVIVKNQEPEGAVLLNVMDLILRMFYVLMKTALVMY